MPMGHELPTHYDPSLVALSILVAMFASYTALSLAGSVTRAPVGRARLIWLAAGSLAMGIGIWSMHFVGMLAFSMPGMTMAYDLPLMLLSIVIAIGASAIALEVVSRQRMRRSSYAFAGVAMGAAIAGMHYTGMASMRMPAAIRWDYGLVALSIVIAMVASFGALWIAFQLRYESSRRTHLGRALGGVVMGVAISGMHYTGMIAANFVPSGHDRDQGPLLIASSGLTGFVLGSTLLILAIALASSQVDRALARRSAQAEESARLFREAERAVAALREERELRERFVSSLTHDLRTPLTAGRLNAQLLDRLSSDPDKARAARGKIIESFDRADEMIQNLLDAHRITAARGLPLHLERCDLDQLVRKTLEELTPVHGDRFRFVSPGSVTGWWDGRYLRRLVENLCSNAIKYGEAGRPVTITLQDAPTVGQVELSVHNEGIALSADEQQDLFRMFHRSKSAQSSGARGWGIGLTLVKGVAESHGGSVAVSSSRGAGTTFVVTLPKDGRQAAVPASSRG